MKLLIPIIALGSVLLAGCGLSQETKLTFTLSGSGDPVTKTIKCPKGRGCEELFKVPKKTWEPLPANTICTKIWGGPERLSVGGKIKGQQINASFSLSGGCEIDRWDEISPLLKEVFGEDPRRGTYAAL